MGRKGTPDYLGASAQFALLLLTWPTGLTTCLPCLPELGPVDSALDPVLPVCLSPACLSLSTADYIFTLNPNSPMAGSP